jgi:hypothetical protein
MSPLIGLIPSVITLRPRNLQVAMLLSLYSLLPSPLCHLNNLTLEILEPLMISSNFFALVKMDTDTAKHASEYFVI